MHKIVISLAFFAASVLPASAQSQLEMNGDAAKKAGAADKKLNATYQKVIKKNSQNGGFVAKLRTAEKAWIGYRDAYLRSIFPAQNAPMEYGSVYPMCYSEWLETTTSDRTKQLEGFLSLPANSALPEATFLSEEKHLNLTYQKVLKIYENKYVKKFQQAEVAWLAFRDADAQAFASLAPASNPVNARFTWQSQLDRQRTKELQQWIDGTEEGNVCAGTIPIRQK